MAAGIASNPMTMEEVVGLIDAAEGPPKRGPYKKLVA
jgi:hypothetical protein